MRNISFALTTEQVRNRTKTVTRRLGWKTLKEGTLLQPVVKAQGLKKGEQTQKIGGPIRVVRWSQEPLAKLTSDLDYGLEEVRREGFAEHPMVLGSPLAFVEYFCNANRPCEPTWIVTRIEFEYVE